MASKIARCTVVEIPASSQGGLDDAPPRDLLPWGDPYIVRLLNKHRLQAALDDSISFVETESAAKPVRPRELSLQGVAASTGPTFPRFDVDYPFSD